jgi:hypothetical protein
VISLLAPLGLGLAALAGAPLVIHWLTRQRTVVRVFPALALLRGADAGRSARNRLREWLVLALRGLALLACALAAAGPRFDGLLLGSSAAPVVVVLDASASMQQVVGGATAFERARALASQVVGSAAPRPVGLVVAGGPQPIRVAPSATPGPALAALAEATVGNGDGDPAGALAAAAALLSNGGEIVVVSDLARTSTAGIDPAALPPGCVLRLLDAGPGAGSTPRNRGVTALGAEPALAVAGRPLTVTARISSCSTQPETVAVRLQAGATVAVREVTVPPGGSADARLEFAPEHAGWLEITAELPGGDALAVDDHRSGALEVRSELVAVLVTDQRRDDPLGAARPLAAALTAAGFSVRPADSAGVLPSGAAVIATVGLRATPPSLTAAISTVLASGGAWLQVVDSEADAALAAATPPAGTPAPAPVALGRSIDVSAQERGVMALGAVRLEHPLLAAFVGRDQLLRGFTAWRYYLSAAPAPDAEVILAWADGTVACAERPVGAGRWLLLNASPAAAASQLAGAEAFPLLLSRLPAAVLPTRAARLAVDCGGRIPALGELRDPNGLALAVLDGGQVLPLPGIYRAPGGRLVAAAVPAGESDLRPLDAALLPTGAVRGGSAAGPAPLWPWLLLLAAAFLVAESLLAGRVSVGPRVSAKGSA